MLTNSQQSYGSIAKWFHWLTALLFIAAYASVYYRHWFTEYKTPENWTVLHLHLSFGLSIGVLFLLRLIWKIKNPSPQPLSGSKLQHRLAKSGHWMLYAVMLAMPLTGYLGTGIDTNFFGLFDVANFKDSALFQNVLSPWLAIDFKTFEQPIDFVHKQVGGKILVWMLILGHIGAALYHHFILKDQTLIRMLPTKTNHQGG